MKSKTATRVYGTSSHVKVSHLYFTTSIIHDTRFRNEISHFQSNACDLLLKTEAYLHYFTIPILLTSKTIHCCEVRQHSVVRNIMNRCRTHLLAKIVICGKVLAKKPAVEIVYSSPEGVGSYQTEC